MINRLMRKWKGYVTFRIRGHDVGGAVSAIIHQRVQLWNMRKQDGEVLVDCYSKEYKRAARIARQKHCLLRVVERHGLPFILHRYRFRKGIAVGCLALVTLLFVLSSFVWSIDVNGNAAVPTEQILQTAKECGLHTGMFRYGLDLNEVEYKLRSQYGIFAWVSINQIGTHISIEVSESVAKPELIDRSELCHVVAAYSGVVRRVSALGGNAVVKEGEVVKQGQILISGIVDDQLEQTHYYHAYGTVIAEVDHLYTFTQPLSGTRTIATGQTKDYPYLSICGLTLPMFWGSIDEQAQLQSTEYHAASVFGLALPFGVLHKNYEFYQTETLQLDEAGAKRLLQEQVEQTKQQELSGAKILNRVDEYQINQDSVTLKVKFTVEQEIGVQQKFYLTDQQVPQEPKTEE